MNTKTLVIVGSSTVIGFLGDVLTYSVAASKGKKFTVVVPKGKDLVSVLALGIVGGFIIDYAVKQIEESLKTKQEKALDRLVAAERDKILNGKIEKQTPVQILWS